MLRPSINTTGYWVTSSSRQRSVTMSDHRIMTQLTIILIFTFFIGTLLGQEAGYADEGLIHGITMKTRNNRTIWAYLGIPYAEPPVGPLRFKNPRRKWNTDTLPGDTDGNVCPQLNNDGQLIGDEDCLYLNVYTPESLTLPEELYPTMVYFHGGQFIRGSGTSADAGPDYLMDKDIILITVNYRLGALGFLSTGDDQAPGNFGLKDQVIALQWVEHNIIWFLGDPKKVTIFGEGAGGVCTSLHALSPLSDGLFQQFISQSGTAVAYWARGDVEDYPSRAFDLGKKLNCSTKNSASLIDCLRTADVYSLVNSDDIFKDDYFTFSSWRPTAEEQYSYGAFLDIAPPSVLSLKGIKDVPAMIGNVADEGLIVTAEFYNNDDFYEMVANDLNGFLEWIGRTFWDSDRAEDIARDLYSYFLNGTDTSDKESLINILTHIITDVGYVVPFYSQMELLNKIAETMTSNYYYYSFDYRGTYSKTYRTTGNNDNIGVTHGDDIIYLFPVNPNREGSTDLRLSESDEKMIDIMVELWTSFARTGIPTVNATSDMDPVRWEPYRFETKAALQIGNGSDPTTSVVYNLNADRLSFWYEEIAAIFAGFLDIMID